MHFVRNRVKDQPYTVKLEAHAIKVLILSLGFSVQGTEFYSKKVYAVRLVICNC